MWLQQWVRGKVEELGQRGHEGGGAGGQLAGRCEDYSESVGTIARV